MSIIDLIQSSELLIVLKWWFMWQAFDWVLSAFKVKLRKPWVVKTEK